MTTKIEHKEHGMCFTAQSVCGIQAGRKSQTRRVVTFQNSITAPHVPRKRWDELDFDKAYVDEGPSPAGNPGPYLHVAWPQEDISVRVYPRIQPGDCIWAREALRPAGAPQTAIYASDDSDVLVPGPDGLWPAMWRWKRGYLPSRFMPRRACRILLEVTKVRVERVQEISEADAIAEGIERIVVRGYGPGRPYRTSHPVSEFADVWNSINARRGYGWDANPWAWCYTFKRVEDE